MRFIILLIVEFTYLTNIANYFFRSVGRKLIEPVINSLCTSKSGFGMSKSELPKVPFIPSVIWVLALVLT